MVAQYLKAAALFLDEHPGAAVGQSGLNAAAVSAFCRAGGWSLESLESLVES